MLALIKTTDDSISNHCLCLALPQFAITEEIGAAEELIANYPPLRMQDVNVKADRRNGR